MRRTWVTLFALLSATQAAAQGRVLVVDLYRRAGYHHQYIQFALNAAKNNDTILLRSGSHGTAKIDGKTLTLVADGKASLRTLEIVNAKGPVTIRGINLSGTAQSTTLIKLRYSTGQIALESVTTSATNTQTAALDIQWCTSVALTKCRIAGRPAVNIKNSNVRIYESECTGVEAHSMQPGGNGLTMDFGSVFASQSIFTGGRGGPAFYWPTYCHVGNGGHGFAIGSGRATFLDCRFAAGPVGRSISNCRRQGPAPQPRFGPAASFTDLRGRGRSLTTAAAPRENTNWIADFHGQPADTVGIAVNLGTSPFWFPACQGFAFPSLSNMIYMTAGRADAQGKLRLSLKIPDLGPAIDSVSLVTQGIALDAKRACTLTSPTFSTLLDRRF